MKQRILAIFVCTLLSLAAVARPARTGIYTFHQPDGTSFLAKIYGDEFHKVKTTADGHAIMQDKDGWWCYAQFSQSGERICSGYHVGAAVPGIILYESSDIPHDKIAEKARLKRTAANANRPPLMRRLMQQNQ